MVGQAGEEVATIATWVLIHDVLDRMMYLFKYDAIKSLPGISTKLVPQFPVPEDPRRADRADAGLMSEMLLIQRRPGH